MSAVEVRSRMTAAVLWVSVNEGDDVAEGDTLLVVESMKMEIPILAPLAGRVTGVAVGAGDVVAEGDVLAVVET
jgi:acetyl-CoA carboxylase biotin carboxyl carrier protein